MQINLWTYISAFLGFVTAEVFKDYLFGPRAKQRELRARIHSALLFYANAYVVQGAQRTGHDPEQLKKWDEHAWSGQQELRKLAAELLGSWGGWRPVIQPDRVRTVHSKLLGLSNTVRNNGASSERSLLASEIAEVLELPYRDEDFGSEETRKLLRAAIERSHEDVRARTGDG